jgi:hypothetical protein
MSVGIKRGSKMILTPKIQIKVTIELRDYEIIYRTFIKQKYLWFFTKWKQVSATSNINKVKQNIDYLKDVYLLGKEKRSLK